MVNTGSFIPEKKGKTGLVRRKRKVYVLNYIAYTFFFGAALTVAGLFVWSLYLDGQIEEQSAVLANERQRFSQSDIERVRELDQRLNHTAALLRSTPFVSQILTALEAATPANMSFSGLQLSQTGAMESATGESFGTELAYNNYDSYTIAIEGASDNFNKVLFQQSVLKDNSVLTMAEVAELTYGGDSASTEQASNAPITFTIRTQVPFSAIINMNGTVSSQPENTDFNADSTTVDDLSVLDEGEVVDFGDEVMDEELFDDGDLPVDDANQDTL